MVRAEPPTSARTVSQAIEQVRQIRGRLLTTAGPPAVAIAILIRLLSRRRRLRERFGRIEVDPLLAALADGGDLKRLEAAHPLRAAPDLALEKPRFGESKGASPDWMRAADELDAALEGADVSGDPYRRLNRLRGRARLVLAHLAAQLRWATLELGRVVDRDDVFEWPFGELTALGRTDPAPQVRSPAEPLDPAPFHVTLAALEAWAAEGQPPVSDAHDRERPGVWIGGSARIEGTIVAAGACSSNDPDPVAGRRPVVVIDTPYVNRVAALDPGLVLLSAGGSALCHAAMIIRQRQLTALLAAGPLVRELRPGDEVTLTRKGQVIVGARAPGRRSAPSGDQPTSSSNSAPRARSLRTGD